MSNETPKDKHIKVDADTHAAFKKAAKNKGKTLMAYMAALAKRVTAATGAVVCLSLIACTPTSPTSPSESQIDSVMGGVENPVVRPEGGAK